MLLLALEWAVACLTLGRPPIPMIDDPKSIGPISSLLHPITGVFLVTIIAVPFTLPLAWLHRSLRSRQSVLIAIACFIFPFGSMFILRADPFDIVEWWFD